MLERNPHVGTVSGMPLETTMSCKVASQRDLVGMLVQDMKSLALTYRFYTIASGTASIANGLRVDRVNLREESRLLCQCLAHFQQYTR